MKLTMRPYRNEDDFWRIRNFLREIFLLNNRQNHSYHVAHFDHWRWHYVLTCHETDLPERVTTLWETDDGQIAAVLHPICHDEIRMYLHPQFHTRSLEEEIIIYAEQHHSDWYEETKRILYVPAYTDDAQRQEILLGRGYSKRPWWEHHWWRDLDTPIPDVPVAPGYTIRSMGAEDELPARSWASWRAFHADEPDENYDGDYSWYRNMQSAPLYRRDLDIVAAAPNGEIAAFCTISYDDYTRSALIVLEGTAAEHLGQGLIQAMVAEGLRRLKRLGNTRVFAIASNETEDELYRPVMQSYQLLEPWFKVWTPNKEN